MSAKSYELSVWKDEFVNGLPNEYFVAVIGSNQMTTPFAVVDPKLTRQINGQKKLDFTLYTHIRNYKTGELEPNPFCDMITNESKIKLRDGEGENAPWYDFIVKTIKEDSSKHTWSISCSDQLVEELSKNGFNLQFDTELHNNQGDIYTLASRVVSGTNWLVQPYADTNAEPDADFDEITHYNANTAEESLVVFSIQDSFGAGSYQINDEQYKTKGYALTETEISNNFSSGTVYAFYSSCSQPTTRFQFYYYTNTEIPSAIDRVITDTNHQYYLDLSTPTSKQSDGFYYPSGLAIQSADTDITANHISLKYRGERYVFSAESEYYSKLDSYGTLYHYVDDTKPDLVYVKTTQYISPTLIDTIVTNGKDFTSTGGWRGTNYGNLTDYYKPSASYKCVTKVGENEYDQWEYLDRYSSLENVEFKPTIRFDLLPPVNDNNNTRSLTSNYTCYILNSGPYDKRSKIETFVANDKYLFDGVFRSPVDFNVYLGQYTIDGTTLTSLTKISNTITVTRPETGECELHQTPIIINSNFNQTPIEYKNTYTGLFFEFNLADGDYTSSDFIIYSASLYKALWLDSLGGYITPDTQDAQVRHKYLHTWYNYNDLDNIDLSKDELTKAFEITTIDDADIPNDAFIGTMLTDYNTRLTCQKVRSISIKDSNYYNILQKLAETFGMWLEIGATRNSIRGDINQRWVRFRNYIGREQLAGFKYGVNINSITRNINSNDLVTKLIVKTNNNQFGINKYCTIARATANETGSNTLFNIDYYIDQQLISSLNWLNYYYGEGSGNIPNRIFKLPSGYRPNEPEHDKLDKLLQYYTAINPNPLVIFTPSAELGYANNLKMINNFLNYLSSISNNILLTKADINSKIATNEAALKAAEEGKVSAELEFAQILNIDYKPNSDYTEDQKAIIAYKDNRKYSEAIWTFEQAINNAQSELGDYTELIVTNNNIDQYLGVLDDFENIIILGNAEGLYKQRNELLLQECAIKRVVSELQAFRDALDADFYSYFYRYFKEGTWIDESYYDDDLYYNDALSTLYNSCYPKVSYSLNVADLSCIPKYADYKFDLGDQTFVEDVDVFGYENDSSTPKREPITITELTTNFADPTKNSIKVQTYRNQFQDLFSQTTATVQSVQYSEGGYKRAAALEAAEIAKKQAFLQDVTAIGNLTQNAGTNVWLDDEGLTSTSSDGSSTVRINNGAIAFRFHPADQKDAEEHGLERWTTAISSKGINAELLTAGVINTGELSVMNGREPMFRWDKYGLSAFWNIEYSNNIEIDFTKFVRFDQYGIYGIDSNAFTTDNNSNKFKRRFYLHPLKVDLEETASSIEIDLNFSSNNQSYSKITFTLEDDQVSQISYYNDNDGNVVVYTSIGGWISEYQIIEYTTYNDTHFNWIIQNSSDIQLGTYDGRFWHASRNGQYGVPEEILNKANFYLTWEGLGIKNGNAQVLIGKQSDSLIRITNNGVPTFNIDQNGNAKFNGEVTASKLIITPSAETNIVTDKIELAYYGTIINIDDTSINSIRVKTAPGRTIRVDYKVKTTEGAHYTRKLTLLHQFYSDEMGSRITYYWADAEDEESPSSDSPAYDHDIGTNYKLFSTIVTVPDGCYYYSLGLRATTGEGQEGALVYTDIAIYGASLTNAYLNSFDIEASSIRIQDQSDILFQAKNSGTTTEKVIIANYWHVDNNSLYVGQSPANPSAFISSGDNSYNHTICGITSDEWVFGASDQFGVNKAGELYANQANLTGKIESSEGKIGGWNISTSNLSGSVNIPVGSSEFNSVIACLSLDNGYGVHKGGHTITSDFICRTDNTDKSYNQWERSWLVNPYNWCYNVYYVGFTLDPQNRIRLVGYFQGSQYNSNTPQNISWINQSIVGNNIEIKACWDREQSSVFYPWRLTFNIVDADPACQQNYFCIMRQPYNYNPNQPYENEDKPTINQTLTDPIIFTTDEAANANIITSVDWSSKKYPDYKNIITANGVIRFDTGYFNTGYFTDLGSSDSRIAHSYFTNANITNATISNISGTSIIGSADSHVNVGYFTQLGSSQSKITDVYITNAYITNAYITTLGTSQSPVSSANITTLNSTTVNATTVYGAVFN